ncbi:hypothetical protein M9435_002051 [Picochlorum sp. BPE23]|nr:hypothetical protein M9435_002051 [Picochlorum sp. BPE23]
MKPNGGNQRVDTFARMRTKIFVGIFVVFVTATFLLPNKLFGGTPGFPSVPTQVRNKDTSEDSSYAVVIDAGSTGSRVHVFKFLHVRGELELNFDEFEQLKPGLSSYADNPEDAAKSLQPLLEKALATVPKSKQTSTPIMVGATAGLRLLPDGKADVILDHVTQYLKEYPFKFDENDVQILSGQNEGAFAWLTLNYLLGNLGRPYDETVAAIDLGGGSVQQAFAMGPNETKKAPKQDYITTLRGGGKEYSVYVHSYLGYGLMAARAAVLEIDPNGPKDDSHPCIHEGYNGTYTYGSDNFVAQGHDDGAQHDQCMATVLSALKKDEKCGAPQPQCSFQGAWSGSRIPEIFYVSSYFWDRAADAGLLDDDKATQAVVSPKHFKDHAEEACDMDVKSVKKTYPRIQEEHSPYFCLDLTYAHTLLTTGFKIPEDREITLVKKVKYKGEYVETAWALGAAINMLS